MNGMWPSWSDIKNGVGNAVSAVGDFVVDHKQQIIAVGIGVGRLTAKRMSGELLTEYTYNNLGRISDIKHSGITDKRYSYAYNGLGHRVGQMYVRL